MYIKAISVFVGLSLYLQSLVHGILSNHVRLILSSWDKICACELPSSDDFTSNAISPSRRMNSALPVPISMKFLKSYKSYNSDNTCHCINAPVFHRLTGSKPTRIARLTCNNCYQEMR